MNSNFEKSLRLTLLLLLACGEDPILTEAKQIEKEKVESKKEQTVKETKEIPEVLPPKSSVSTPNVLPKIEPPKAQTPPKKEKTEPPPPQQKEEMVSFSGEIRVENWSGKPIRIDIFDGDQRNIGGKRPSVVRSEIITTTGPFTLFVPKSELQLWIGAYIDEDQDGRPGPQDPSGWYSANPVTASSAQTDISISLELLNDPKAE